MTLESPTLEDLQHIDIPSDLDYRYSDVFNEVGDSDISDIEYKKKKVLDYLMIFNQHSRPETKSACGFYGLEHNVNAQKIWQDPIWGKGQQIDPAERRIKRQPQRHPDTRGKGTSLQGNLAMRHKSRGIIDGYVRCETMQEAKDAIDRGNFIYTGSAHGDWVHVRLHKIYRERSDKLFVGHLFFVCGYNDKGFIGVNSGGPSNGFFTIPYNTRNTLYSKYAVVSEDYKDFILKYKNMSNFDKEFDKSQAKGITNGERPNDQATRKETAVMVYRGIEKMKIEILEEVNKMLQSQMETIVKVIKERL